MYPGAGELDFKAILSTLESTGYGGYISGEFLPLPDSESAAKLGITYLKQIQMK
jgi:sugar phosphate isomerase/epimerase